MMQHSVRPFEEAEDLFGMIDYFLDSPPDYLKKMGADPEKLPKRTDWFELLWGDLSKPLAEKKFYYLLWELDGQAVGHNNINQIEFGQQAFMHLHLWEKPKRQQGIGTAFLKQSIPIFFEIFQLQTLFCEPNAFNPGPNRTLAKLGFKFIKQHEINPGWINFVQPINRWALQRSDLEVLI
jgi:RimJ/RimL family protein N-acetyltransferase